MDSKKMVEDYLKQIDWRVNESSSCPYSFGGMSKYMSNEVSKNYWLRNIYPAHIGQAYANGDIHIHDLGGLTVYCCGYSLQEILMKGVKGVPNIPTSSPAKHFDSVLNQLANLTTVFQNEIMGAVAFNSVDTLLAPFIKVDGLTYDEVKQSMQNFIFTINSNSRIGAEPAFTNMTFDLTPPHDLLDDDCIIGGELTNFKYSDCQTEIDMFNKAFCEVMIQGDSAGKLFSYPIPTYNIHERFDWDNPNNDVLFEMAGKYGTPYFANFCNSDMDVRDIRSMCPLTTDTLVMVKSKKGIVIRNIGDIVKSQTQHETEYKVWNGSSWVNAKFNKQSKQKVLEIKFSNGTSVKMGEFHYQRTINGDMQARNLAVGMWIPFNNNCIETDEIGTRDLGYAIGAYIGDGSTDGCRITYSLDAGSKDDETITLLTEFWNKLGYTTSVCDLKRNCRNLSVNGNPYDIIKRYVIGKNALEKDLSKLVFNMSEDFKVGLLRGFSDTYGSRDKKRLYTSSSALRNSMQSLLSSMGERVLVNYVDDRDGRLGTEPNYRIDYPERQNYGNLYKSDNNFNYFTITDITEVENYTGDLYCCEVQEGSPLFMLANGLITHNCRLSLDLKELRRKNGGLFGAGDSTGSIGVVTVNLPRIGYIAENVDEFRCLLDDALNIAKESLEIKRAWLNKHILGTGMIPAFDEYVGTINNHFSSIGVVGENEMCLNFIGKDILSDEGKQFALDVESHIRKRLVEFQEETGNLYNFEATPAESTAYRMAKKDVELYEDIITQGSGDNVYYTNSCHIPVGKVTSIKDTFDHQDELQVGFTGGTVIHIYLEDGISGEQAKSIIKTVCTQYRVPYISLSPISRQCQEHGYIKGNVDTCPICGNRLKKFQRITGYLRCVDDFNIGKKQEFADRVQLDGKI